MRTMREKSVVLVAVSAACCLSSLVVAAQPPAPIQQVEIVADKMCCAGCARKVSGQLYAAKGVRDVAVDLKAHTVKVTLPQPSAAKLGQLWHYVEQSDGGPTKLVTAAATYTLIRPKADANTAQQLPPQSSPLYVVIDNLHCQGCAKKIAAQIYAIKGVTKVSVDMAKETLTVETARDTQISPWAVIDAVSRAKERPLAVLGSHGQLTIEWANKATPKNHQQAQQPNLGGLQR
ncbi:Heavy-metal-associated domain protein [Adhaeretor mobilis]|uniref:Heavy-metal-associated domain protein n=2 Tax=Adhaeretor mobilis TaxID=1930276 RepID=A0A517MQA0_9BACT|nr:Heavy-metal-associated domain protein [Adhaeretor mobilis]